MWTSPEHRYAKTDIFEIEFVIVNHRWCLDALVPAWVGNQGKKRKIIVLRRGYDTGGHNEFEKK